MIHRRFPPGVHQGVERVRALRLPLGLRVALAFRIRRSESLGDCLACTSESIRRSRADRGEDAGGLHYRYFEICCTGRLEPRQVLRLKFLPRRSERAGEIENATPLRSQLFDAQPCARPSSGHRLIVLQNPFAGAATLAPTISFATFRSAAYAQATRRAAWPAIWTARRVGLRRAEILQTRGGDNFQRCDAIPEVDEIVAKPGRA